MMPTTEETPLIDDGHGLRPEGDGWFVVNVADAAWGRNERFGTWCDFEGDSQFSQFGINVHVLEPGQPNGLYHRENQQESFLVLHGECTLIIEEQERHLRAWDFVHCPPGTTHIFVGAGSGPCAILMVGARDEASEIHYPLSDVAIRHGAGAQQATDVPAEAYAGSPDSGPAAAPWPLGPGP